MYAYSNHRRRPQAIAAVRTFPVREVYGFFALIAALLLRVLL